MHIKILGSGCAKCNHLEQMTREMVVELGVEASFEHVRDMAHIMAYPVISTPALVIDEEVKVSGRIPSRQELQQWLKPVSPA